MFTLILKKCFLHYSSNGKPSWYSKENEDEEEDKSIKQQTSQRKEEKEK